MNRNSISTTQLAKICGVSQGTVDRALNNRKGINKLTKEKVLAAAKEYGYRPNVQGRSPLKRKMQCIGIILPDLRDNYLVEFADKLEKSATLRGFSTVIMFSAEKSENRELDAAAEILDEGPLPVKMGAEEEKLLRSIDFYSLRRRRVENTRLFMELLAPLEAAGKLRFVTDAPENSGIYFPVYLEKNRKVQAALAEKGIYSAVLWPIPPQAEGLCPVTEYVVGHILGIPCDQRCNEADVRFMVETLGKILGE